jgi:hypothetical protein
LGPGLVDWLHVVEHIFIIRRSVIE